MNKLRKLFTASVMVMTLAVMLGFGSFAHAATPQAGDLIKMDGLSTVYFLGNDSKRYVFPHESVFFSWHRDFSGVVTVSASELQSYPLGANVTIRPGTKLVKITTDPSVYAVEPNGVLRKIQSESDAIAVYGPNWSKRVIDVADSFFTNYTIGQPLASNEIAAGTLVKNANDASVYYFDGTNYRSIASESAFYANRFSFNDVITISQEITPKANAISNNEFAYDAQNATGPVTTASGVTVSLSSATPAAASLVATQALAPLTSVNLTAANDGSVILKSIKFKKMGLASDSSVDSFYLYDGNTRLTDNSSMSNGYVNFSGASLITIPAGQTKTLTVKADMASGASTGNIGLSLVAASDVISTGATVNGSFPINGNLMSLFAAPADMATVGLVIAAETSASVKAGTTNAVVWATTATIGMKAVDFKYLALQQIGSIQKDDLANFAIYVDGIKAGNGTFEDNKLIFDLSSNAHRINTGNHVIEVKADIVKGSNRNFSFQMQTKANIVFTDTNYNVNVAPSAIINGLSHTISFGSTTVAADSSFNATEIVRTASNATLARFTMKAWGEDVKVNSLKASVDLVGTASATTTEGMNDLAIYVDGTQVGSSQSFTATSSEEVDSETLTFGTNNLFTIEAGEQVTIEIKGSLSLDQDTAISSVITNLVANTNNAQGVTSYQNITTNGDITGKTLSIVSGSVKVAKNGALQSMNVSKNSQKVKIGSYILSAGSAEGVVISNIKVGLATTTVDTGNLVMDNISNLYVSENTNPVQPQGTNDFNVNLSLAANATKVIDVYADLNELDDGDKFETTMSVTYRTATTMNSGTTTAIDGQEMTVATGDLGTPTLVSTPNSFFVLGGSEATAASYKFVADNADAYINELRFATVTNGINQIIVNGVSAVVVDGEAKVSGLNIKIPAGTQGANVEVKAVYNNVTSAGQGGIETYADQKFVLDGYKFTVNGTQADDDTVSIASKAMKLVASYPLVANALNYTDTTLKVGPKTEVMRFTVTATGNSLVNLEEVGLNPSYNYGVATTTYGVSIYDAANLGVKLGSTTMVTSGSNMVLPFDDAVTIDNGAAKTFVVYADTTGTLETGTNYFGLSLVNAGWAWNDGTTATSTDGTHIAEFTGTTFSLSN